MGAAGRVRELDPPTQWSKKKTTALGVFEIQLRLALVVSESSRTQLGEEVRKEPQLGQSPSTAYVNNDGSRGQHSSPGRRRSIFPKTLLVPLILTLIFIIFYWLNKGIGPKLTIVYPNWTRTPNRTTPPHAKPPLTACGVPVQRDPMIKVGDHKTYVIGSYVEHRFSRKTIRTVAIVLRSEDVKYYCLLCCDGRNISVPANLDIHSDHFGFEYGAADITCEVPVTCTTPTYVAVTYPKHEENDLVWNIQSFQPVGNQQSRDEHFSYMFTICISAMFDYWNVLELVQALEMFKILGVQKVAIYNSSCNPDTQKVLKHYVKQGFVDIIPWKVTDYIRVSRGWQKSVSPGELHYFGQIAALNDCVYRYMYESHYVALQDLDEFILPEKEDNWTTLIPQLERNYPGRAGFEFENNIFPLAISEQRQEYKPDSWNHVTGENILLHVKRLPVNPNEFSNFKVIVNPRRVFRTTVHGLLDSSGGTVRVDHGISHMYHMRNVTQEELKLRMINDTRLWDYAKKLIPAVSIALKEVFNIH